MAELSDMDMFTFRKHTLNLEKLSKEDLIELYKITFMAYLQTQASLKAELLIKYGFTSFLP